MDEYKTKRINEQYTVMFWTVLCISLGLLIAGLLVEENDSKRLLITLGSGFFIGIGISKLFKKDIGYKPTREEIEERMFGNKKDNEVEHKN
ncbi:MAG: hypothetical protein KA290_09525 [Chitinophagaceae bacterium]|nr:hypothetical protein [Chitinophagaceae bacterium]MBP8115886.1 hypothetical protein [Chitinophagaceae bacterium]